MASQIPRSLAAHNTPGPFWGGAPAPAPPRPAPAPKPTQPKPTQPTLRLDPSLKRLHDELVAQKADPSILKDWTTEKRKDGPNRGDRVYYVDPHGKAHRSAPAARRAILNTGPVTPPKKRKTQDKDRSQLVKWKLSGCTVAVTPAPARTATRVAPPAPNTWPQERPALGLKLDSEAVIRQMQQQQHNGGPGSPAGWTSPPQQPEAMPPSMRSMLPMDPLPSNGEALPHLVGDLFGAQAQAAICNGGLLNGHSYASSPSTVLQQTGAAPCPVEFNDTVQILCNEPQLAKGYLLNGNGKVQAVAVVNGGGNHGIVNGRLRDDDIDMSEV